MKGLWEGRHVYTFQAAPFRAILQARCMGRTSSMLSFTLLHSILLASCDS